MAVTTAIVAGASSAYSVYSNYQGQKRAAKAQAEALASAPSSAADQMKANQVALDAQAAQRRKSTNALGRGSTVLTGPSGLTNPSPPATKTLLGL